MTRIIFSKEFRIEVVNLVIKNGSSVTDVVYSNTLRILIKKICMTRSNRKAYENRLIKGRY